MQFAISPVQAKAEIFVHYHIRQRLDHFIIANCYIEDSCAARVAHSQVIREEAF